MVEKGVSGDMGRKKYRRNRGMSEMEKFQWVVASVVFAVVFVVLLAYGFVAHCVIEWPIRWDVGTCWHEQVDPASKKAAEAASNFIP